MIEKIKEKVKGKCMAKGAEIAFLALQNPTIARAYQAYTRWQYGRDESVHSRPKE